MRELSDMLQEFAGICRKYPQYGVTALCNSYFKQLDDRDFLVADRYFYWFVMVGDAARNQDSII